MAQGWMRAAGTAWRLSQAAGNAAQSAAANAANNHVSRGARNGILGPWDAPPPPGVHGYWDYRGVARPADITPCTLDFPLGRYREPRRWTARDDIGISERIANEHSLVLGPTRSGKTASIIAPWIYHALRLGYSVLAVDVKGRDDLIGEVKRYSTSRGSLGAPALKWDYNDPARSVSWDWISGLRSDAEINAAVEAICGRPNPADPNRFFHQVSMKYLRGLLQLAPTIQGKLALADIVRLLNDQRALSALVAARSGHPGAGRLSELCPMAPGEFIKYTAELKTHLETLDMAGFASVTKTNGFAFDHLRGSSPVLMIVSAPTSDGELARAAGTLFLGQFVQRALTGFGTHPRPTLLVLDEAARVQDRIDLGATLSLVAGAGVSVLLATQDVSQFEAKSRDEILANCGTMICLPRVSSETTDYFIRRMGEMPFTTRSSSTSTDRRTGGNRSWTTSTELASVIGHREISTPAPQLGPRPAFVHSPSLSPRPIVVDLARQDLVP
jgi:type IV secretory pathway TraG/TraD family ATPase VirD4